MKIKLLNYTKSDFKYLEKMLEEYSQAGYNPETIGKVTVFKKGPRRHYLAVPFVSYQTSKKAIATEKIAWFERMALLDCEYLGHTGGIHVFASATVIDYQPPKEPLTEYFLKGELLKRVLSALAILVGGLFLIKLIYNGEVSQYLTNGRILLEWVLYFGVVAGVLINGAYGFQAVKIGRKIATMDSDLTSDSHKLLQKAKVGLILAFCLLLLGGFGLDNYNNDRSLESGDQVIDLAMLNVTGEIANRQFTTNHSYLIPYSYSYFEQAGSVDEEAGTLGDLLKVNYYQFASDELQSRIFDGYLDLDSQNLDHLMEIDDGVYLGFDKSLDLYSNLYLNRGDVCLIVYTNIDLNVQDRVATILDNYLVD